MKIPVALNSIMQTSILVLFQNHICIFFATATACAAAAIVVAATPTPDARSLYVLVVVHSMSL